MNSDATILLRRLSEGDADAASELLPLIYSELRGLAGGYFRNQPADHTLQPTALVHEAFLRLIDHSEEKWNGRAHFFAVAATAMRQILVDSARRRRSLKRGGGRARLDASEVDPASPARAGDALDPIDLDDALTTLAQSDPRRSRVVELRFFGGLSMPEIAEALGVSLSTAEADWRAARAWLAARLSADDQA